MAVRLVHRRVGADDIVFRPILQMRDYIESKRGGRAFAARRDILPEEIGFALGHVIIMDVREDPLDFVYRLYGSEISRGDHDEVTKRSVFDQEPAAYRDHLMDCYVEAVRAREPVYHHMTVSDGHRAAEYQRGLFPLSDDGRSVNMLLSVTWWGDDLAPIWDRYLAGK